MAERAFASNCLQESQHQLAPSYNIEFDLDNPHNPQIQKNIETDLGERFNVVISRAEYEFEGKFLKAVGESEPFTQTIIRGIEDRKKKYHNPHDRRRELAEFEGFNKIQSVLASSRPDLGRVEHPEKGLALSKSVISISPKGPEDSCYQHNFFDHYEQLANGKILMTRYSSQMSREQFLEATKKLNPNYGQDAQIDDVYFLQNPIKTNLSKDEILTIFHPDYEALKEIELEKLLTACQPLIHAYIASLTENPNETETFRRALLNFADSYIFKPKARDLLAFQLTDADFVPVLASQLAARPVRFVVTGCGAQGDPIQLASGQWPVANFPYSVAEYGKACPECQASTNHFHCPLEKGGCGGQIPSGLGYTTCPHCGLTKEQAGSNC